MKIYLFIVALLLSTNAFANITVHGEVARIYPHGSAVHSKLKNDPCGSTNQYYYFTLNSDIEKAWFALLLAAANTSKPVSVSVPACPTTSYVQVRYIYQDY